MKRFYTLIFTFVFALLLSVSLFAGGSSEKEDSSPVIATTSWTAAFAEVAGVSGAAVLAPYDLQHPPEYEITPSDIKSVSEADMIIYAGYEVMMERLKESAGNDAVMVQITTVNTLPVITESVHLIAEAAGTQEKAEANLKEIQAFFADWKKELAPYADVPVITHSFLAGLAKSLGLTVAGTYGPAPLEAKQLKELTDTGALVIIDNWHTKVGQPLMETMPDAKTAVLINFPGKDGTRTLMDVLEYDREAILAAFR